MQWNIHSFIRYKHKRSDKLRFIYVSTIKLQFDTFFLWGFFFPFLILFFFLLLSHIEAEFTPETSTIVCVMVFGISILVPQFFDDSNASIKVNLMWSTNLMAGILGVLGLYCHLHGSFAPNNTEDYRHIPLICLCLFYFLYATGPQRLSHEYAEKVIPKKCYFTMRSMLATTSWFLIYVITRMLPQLIDHIGVGWLFWFMAAMCVLMSVFVKLFVADLTKMPEEFRLVDNSSSESNSEA